MYIGLVKHLKLYTVALETLDFNLSVDCQIDLFDKNITPASLLHAFDIWV